MVVDIKQVKTFTLKMDETKSVKVNLKTLIVSIVLVLEAKPHVADQALHCFHSHFTVGQVHFSSRASDSGGWGHVWGRPLQSGLKTSTAVSSLWNNKGKVKVKPYEKREKYQGNLCNDKVAGIKKELTALEGRRNTSSLQLVTSPQ